MDRMARWLLLAAPFLVYAQLALLDHDANWGRNRLSGSAEALVAAAALVLLVIVLLRNRQAWKSAGPAVVPAVLFLWAARIGLRHGASLTAGQALLLVLGALAGTAVMVFAVFRPTPRNAILAAVTWFVVPLALPLIA